MVKRTRFNRAFPLTVEIGDEFYRNGLPPGRLTVLANFTRAYPGDRENPPEPSEIDDLDVHDFRGSVLSPTVGMDHPLWPMLEAFAWECELERETEEVSERTRETEREQS